MGSSLDCKQPKEIKSVCLKKWQEKLPKLKYQENKKEYPRSMEQLPIER